MCETQSCSEKKVNTQQKSLPRQAKFECTKRTHQIANSPQGFYLAK